MALQELVGSGQVTRGIVLSVLLEPVSLHTTISLTAFFHLRRSITIETQRIPLPPAFGYSSRLPLPHHPPGHRPKHQLPTFSARRLSFLHCHSRTSSLGGLIHGGQNHSKISAASSSSNLALFRSLRRTSSNQHDLDPRSVDFPGSFHSFRRSGWYLNCLVDLLLDFVDRFSSSKANLN